MSKIIVSDNFLSLLKSRENFSVETVKTEMNAALNVLKVCGVEDQKMADALLLFMRNVHPRVFIKTRIPVLLKRQHYKDVIKIMRRFIVNKKTKKVDKTLKRWREQEIFLMCCKNINNYLLDFLTYLLY